jgi:hypothetical protein
VIATRCPWYLAGPLLGLLIVGLRLAVNKPLGALGGYIAIVDRPRQLGFSVFLLIGVVLGGAFYAVVAGGSPPPDGNMASVAEGLARPQTAALLFAGLAMGIGARTAGGCTSGHGLSGVSLGSSTSLIATMTFFATAVALANLFAWLFGGVS